MKKLIKVMLIAFVICITPFVCVHAEVTLDVAEQYIQRLQFYEMIDSKNAPISESDAGSESINNATGNMTYQATDLSLPGKNGMDVDVTRSLSSGKETEQLTLVTRQNIYTASSNEKYIFRYFINNDEDRPVLLAFDSVQDMLRRENNTNMLKISSEYTNYDRTVTLKHTDGLPSGNTLADDTEIGVTEGSIYYYINEIPEGEDITLYRDLDKGYAEYGIVSIYSYIHEKTVLPAGMPKIYDWDFEMPNIYYTPTQPTVTDNTGKEVNFYYGNLYASGASGPVYICYNGYAYTPTGREMTALNGELYDKPSGSSDKRTFIANGKELVDMSTGTVYSICIPYSERDNYHWEFCDRGTFYDSETGLGTDYKVEYYMKNDGEILASTTSVYNYKPRENNNGEYYSAPSEMYDLTTWQPYNDSNMELVFSRYDGTDLKFEIGSSGTSANIATKELENGAYYTKVYPLIQKTDRYGNTIQYLNCGSSNKEIIDTLGRSIEINNRGIYVNGVQVVSYGVEYITDDTVDPNSMMYEDDITRFTVTDVSTDRSVVYDMKYYSNVYRLGSAYNPPITLTTAAETMGVESVVLPSGGVIHFEYENDSMNPRPLQPSIKQSLVKLTRRYATLPNQAEAINEVHYSYQHGDPEQRVTTVQQDGAGYCLTETFNENGYMIKQIKESTDANNPYYIETAYEYKDAPEAEGNFLPIKETTTTKTSSSASAGQTTVMEYTYNDRQQLTEQKRDGEVVAKNSYSMTYGILTESLQKKNDTQWVGIKNTLDSAGKNIGVSYAATKDGDTEPVVTHESTVYTYNSDGEVASSKVNGVLTNYTYNYGHLWDILPTTTSLTITASVNDTDNITDANGDSSTAQDLTTTEVYDWLGRLIKTTDPNGNITTYEYDGSGRMTKQTNPDSTVLTNVYDDANNTILTTLEDGAKQKIVYDGIGRDIAGYVYQEETGSWLQMYQNSYDARSNLASKTVFHDDGTEKSKITYTYYSDNQPKSETVLEGSTVLSKKEFTYAPYYNSSESQVSAKVYSDSAGYLTASQYSDKLGNRTRDTLAYNGQTYTQSYTTDLLGNILTVKDFQANAEGAANSTVSYTYDYANRVVETTTEAGTTSQTYDSQGRLASETDARGNSIYYTYNQAGWLTKTRQPMTSSQEMVVNQYYDKNGNLTRQETKRDGDEYTVTKSIYDSMGRLTAQVADSASGGVITGYEYDDAGRVTKQAVGLPSASEAIDPSKHQVTTYAYDSLGRLTGKTDPLGQSETYTYNILGELLSKTDRNGAETTYAYDGLSRVKNLTASKEGETSETVSYVYDWMGNVTEMVDKAGTTEYTYNNKGELLTETRGGIAKNYTYDASGNRLSFAVPSQGISVSYGYDGLGRLTSVTDSGVTTNYTYDANGNLLSETTGANRSVTYTYNQANLPTSKTNKRGSTTLDSYTLTYYEDGNIKSVTENGEAKSYTYDEIGRLTGEMTAEGVTQYAYDKYNNRTGKQVYDSANTLQSNTAYTYDKNNRLTDITETVGTSTFYTELGYDANGNQVLKAMSGTKAESGEEEVALGNNSEYVEVYTYDLLNRMVGMNQGDTTASYTYDGTGMRQSKMVNGVTTQHILDGANVVADVTDGAVTKYSRGLGLISRTSNNTTDYYFTNHHGDVTKLVSSTGTVIADYTYDAFGNEVGESSSDMNPFRYCGEYFDAETDSIYLRARYYTPQTGRFISEDTHWNTDNMIYGDSNTETPSIYAILQSSNLYAYCMNDAVNCWDPWGNKIIIEGANSALFKTLQKLTCDSLSMDEYGNIYIVSSAGENSKYKNGTELIRRIYFSESVINITTTTGMSEFDPTIMTVSVNLNAREFLPTYNGDGSRRSHGQQAPDYITMGHELIHAEHYLRGVYNEPYTAINYYIDHNGKKVDDIYTLEEMKTVGPIEWEQENNRHNRNLYTDDITENDLRWEHGIALRSGYRPW